MKKSSPIGFLDRLLDPVGESLNPEAAHKLLAVRADRKTQARVAKLAEKCNEGELTPAERHEYEQYVLANHFIAVLKAKATILLANRDRSQ